MKPQNQFKLSSLSTTALVCILCFLNQSCASIPPGYDGASWHCPIQTQSCVDEYVDQVNHLRSLPLQERLAWLQAQRMESQAIRSIGQAHQPLTDAINRIESTNRLQVNQQPVVIIGVMSNEPNPSIIWPGDKK